MFKKQCFEKENYNVPKIITRKQKCKLKCCFTPLEFYKHYFIKRQSCHHIETSQLICRANQLTGFYMMTTLSFNKLNNLKRPALATISIRINPYC